MRPLRSLNLDLDLLRLLGNVDAGVVFLLLSQGGVVPLLPVLLGAVREVKLVRDVEADGSLLLHDPTVGIQVGLAGGIPDGLSRRGEVGALPVFHVLVNVLLLLVPQSHRRGLLYHLKC